MPVKIISVGKNHEDWVSPGIERYQNRLKRPFDIEWVLLPNSGLDGPSARQKESEAILLRINTTDMVFLLDETGLTINNHYLAQALDQAAASNKQIVFVIGGAFGVNQELMNRADKILSLSGLIMPHQLVRLILIEQIYRSQEILAGRPYHHI